MTLLPELALGFLALFAAYLISWHRGFLRGVAAGRALERDEAKLPPISEWRWLDGYLLVPGCACDQCKKVQRLHEERQQAIAEMCAILGPREVPE